MAAYVARSKGQMFTPAVAWIMEAGTGSSSEKLGNI